MSIRIKQEAIYNGNEWWKWAVWLDGSDKELDEIAAVEYMLHPTFPQPVRYVDKRDTNFRLESSGWGEFKIYAQIQFKNGQTRKRSHWLTLPYPAGQEARSAKTISRSGQAEEKHEGELAVFLSFGRVDWSIAEALTDVLEAEGIEVLKNDDVISDLPWEHALNFLLSRANLAVVIFSEEPSRWVVREAQAIQKKKIPLIPVIVGQGAALSSLDQELEALNLAQLEGIHIRQEADAVSTAHLIVDRIKGIAEQRDKL